LYWHFKEVDITETLRDIKRAIADGRVEKELVAGIDIGRHKNLTEIVVLGLGGHTPVRVMVSLGQVEFDDQERCIRRLVEILPITAVLIDQNGIGMQLAENLARDTICQGITFTNASKALWANELKIEMGRGNVPIPVDRDLAYQIHSIKKTITAAKNEVYDTDANEKHHGDKFWALALAAWAAKEFRDKPEWGHAPQWQRR
jgi:phage FluMu gp28-like protein